MILTVKLTVPEDPGLSVSALNTECNVQPLQSNVWLNLNLQSTNVALWGDRLSNEYRGYWLQKSPANLQHNNSDFKSSLRL